MDVTEVCSERCLTGAEVSFNAATFFQLITVFIVYGCFLDLDPFIFLLYYPVEIAEELRASVHEETGLTCSAGVAPNRMLAKVSLGLIQLDWLFIWR